MLNRNALPASTAVPATLAGSLLRRTTLLAAALLLMGATSWAQLTGTKTVPSVDYPTLQVAVDSLNLYGVGAGGVIIDVTAGNAQTAPVGGYSITATGTLANPITFTGNGNTVTAFAPQPTGNQNDAIFKIIGGDHITIQNFVMQENALNLNTSPGANDMTEWAVALLYASVTNGAQNCSILNNTISLNRAYANTWGIYSNSTHAATTQATSATATSPDGANSGLVIQGNAISNVNNGILVLGPQGAANQNTTVVIGGATAPEGNSITDFGTTGTFSSYANVSGTVNGILIRNTRSYTVQNNTISSSVGGNTSTATIRAVYIPSFNNSPTGTNTQTISNNTISVQGGNATGQVQGIILEGTTSTTTSTLAINNNNFTALNHTTVTASGAITAISTSRVDLNVSISSNSFTNLTTNTTGNFTFLSLSSVTLPTGGSLAVNNNAIVTAFTKSGSGGTVQFYSNGASSPNGTTSSVSNNVISNITLSGSTAFTGINENDWSGASSAPVKTVNGNTMSNLVLGTGTTNIFTVNGGAAGSTVNNNTISTVTRGGATTAFTVGTTTGGVTVQGNTVNGVTGTATGAIVGMSLGTTTTGSPAGVFRQNVVRNLSTTFGSAVTGITISGGSNITLDRNQVFNLEANNASGSVFGITVGSGTAVNLTNNIVGDLRAPLANAANPVVGLNLSGGTTLTASYNTVRLAGTSSGGLFGSSALSASTSPNLTLRNNILVNNTTPAGAGLAVAYRRSSTTLTTYNAASNNNLLYAGTPGTNNLIFFDGNSDQTLAAFKSRVGPTRDAASVAENPAFASTVSGDATFLRFAPATSTQAESGGVAITGIDVDIDADIRQASPGYAGTGTAPDIGADEFEGAPLDLGAPTIVFTALSNSCATGDRTLTATITDASGVPTSGIGLPVLYWRINAGAYTAATATHTGGNLYEFSFGSGVVIADVVQYYIVAQDLAGTPNVGVSPSAGAAGFTADPPAAATPPTTPASYSILNTLSGNYNVGAAEIAPNFTTLTAAVAAYNNQCVSGPVTFTLVDAAYNTGETFPITIDQNVTASATNTLTIRPSGTTTITGSSTSALITLNGADYVTIEGSSAPVTNTVCPAVTSSRDLTLNNTNTGTSSAVVWLATATGSNGATNNTVRNCVIRGAGITTTFVGVGSGGATIASVGTGNNSNRYENNDIGACQIGILSQGASAANKNTGTVISQNLMNAGSPNNIRRTGIAAVSEDGIVVTANIINGVNHNSTNDAFGIAIGVTDVLTTSVTGSEVTNATITNNEIGIVNNTNDYSIVGIAYGVAATGTTLIANNLVSGVSGFGTFGDFTGGIVVGGGAGQVNVYYNNVLMQGVNSGGTQVTTAFASLSATDHPLDLKNNVFVNTSSGGTQRYNAMAFRAPTPFTGITSDNNVLFVTADDASSVRSAVQVAGLVGGTRYTFADWQGTIGQDLSSLNIQTEFVASNNVRTDGNSATNVVMNAAGVTVSGVTTDIDCVTRTSPPDIGANQFDVATCFVPGGFAVSNVTFESAVLNWTSNVGETYNWEVRLTGVGGDPSPAFSGTAASGPVTVNGLDDVTNYTAYIQAVCPGPESSAWSSGTPFSTPLEPVTVFPWLETFTTDNGGFSFVNTGQTNQWVYGSATGNPANSIYISNNGGTSNAYTTGATTVVHTYRDVDFTTPADYTLRFQWKGQGENFLGTDYDFGRAWITPTSYVPVAGSQTTAGPGRVQVPGNFLLQGGFVTVTFPVPDSIVGTVGRLIFEWQNDDFGGTQPPIAIDSVQVTANYCIAPTALNVNDLTDISADLVWTYSTSTLYDYELRTEGAPGSGAIGLAQDGSVAGGPVALTLVSGQAYTAYVRGNCPPDSSAWISFSFVAPCPAETLPISEDFESIVPPAFPDCWTVIDVNGPSGSGGLGAWYTVSTASNGFTGITANYSYASDRPADDWLISPGFNATAGTSYTVKYKYSATSATFPEAMDVWYGNAPLVSAMTELIEDHGTFNFTTASSVEYTFTPAISGIYYVGWHAKSEADNDNIRVDDIVIQITPVCPVATAEVNDPEDLEDCTGNTFLVNLDVTSLGTVPSLTGSYSVFGGGAPTPLTGIGEGITPIGPFDRQDLVFITLQGDGPTCVLDLGRFYSTCPIVIDCDDATPLTVRHCYTENDPRTFTFIANDPERTLDVTFLNGSGIDAADQVDFRAGLPSGGSFNSTPLGTTDLGSLGPQGSSTDSLSLVLLTPSGNSCAAGSPGLGAGWEFTVRCSGCIQPFVQDVIPVVDCAAGTFTLPVEFSYLGFNFTTQADADSAGVRYVVNGDTATIWVQNPGVDPFPVDILGPYPLGATVDITLLHEEGAACNNALAPITVGYYTSCSNDLVCDAFLAPVNPNFTCTQVIPGQMAGATLTPTVPAATNCGGTLTADLWYRFVATQPSQRIQLQNINTGAANMRTSLYGGACDGTLTQIGSCASGTSQLNATGLVAGTTYWVRVATTTASSTQTFNVCISEPPTLDMQVITPLVTPLTTGCYTASEPVTVTLRNNTLFTPIDFTVNPVTVTVTLTGASTTVLTAVVDTGSLAASTNVNVVVGNLDMTAAGVYTFAATATVVGDQVTGNNGFTGQTRTVVASEPLANVALNFDETPGFNSTNLATITSNRWREATGASVPGTGTTSTWNASTAAQNTQLGTGISARIQFTTFASRNEWLVGPKFIPQVGSVLKYKIAITENATGAADGGGGMQAAGATNDRVVVRISTTCGATYQDLFVHDSASTIGLTNAWQQQTIDLSAFAGQAVIVSYWANATSVSTHPNYNFLVDDIIVENEAVCAGTPTEGSISTTATLPICAPASATLDVTGQSNEVGETLSWYSSTTSGGPYTLIPGAVTATLNVSGLTQTTYYVSRNTCLGDDSFMESEEFAVTVSPQPVVLTATNNGPVCAGTPVGLAATSDIGTTFAWTGPGGYTSDQQNPSRVVETNQAGTYSVTATLAGCTSVPLTTTVVVTTSPVISSLTATPNPVCVGADAQLQVTATQPGALGAANYTFSTATGFGLQDMTGSSSLVGTFTDDGQSSLTNIGFTFNFGGTGFTQFGASSNGLMRLGSLPGTGVANDFTVSASILPGWDDLHTGSNGGVSTVLIGSAPDQIRVIEWRVRNFSGESGDFTKTFQVWLYEGTNEVRLVYGVGTDFSPTNGVVGASLGIASAAGSFQSITTSDHSVSTSVQNNGNLPWPGNGRTYLFAPPAPVALTYEWTPNTYLNNDAIANPLAQSVQGSETYVVEVGAPNGCSRLDTLELVSGVELIASIAPADTAICLNESVLLSSVVTGGGTPYTYLWDNPAASTTANITVSPLETTTYTVTVTDNCGISEEAEVTVTINPLPTIVVTPGSALFCGVDTVELVASGAESYLWSPATGLSVTDSSVVTATPTETITYTVTGTDVNGCENTGTATITVSPEVSVTLVPELANVCLGDNTNLVATASPVGFNASASSGTLSLAVPDNDLVTGLTSGLALSGTSSTVGASSVVSVTLNVTHSWNSDLQIYLVGPGNCGTLELSTNNGSSGDNYTNTVLTTPSAFPSITTAFAPMTGNWSPEGTVDGVTNVGTTTLPTTNLVGCPVDGTWNLRVFDNTEGDFGTLIDWSLSVGNGINAGTYSHVITTTGGATIGSVSNSGPNSSVGTAAVSNLDAGVNTFTVVTTSTTGCSATTTTTITAGVPLAVTIETTANPICEGDEMTLTANASGGGEPFSYLWSPGGATTQSIAVSPTDDTEYTVTVEDACDNTVAESVTIVVNDRPSAVASASLACVGGDLQLTGVSDTGTEFTWSGPDGFASTDQNPSISGVTAVNSGDYIFTATLGDCSASSTVSVTVNAASSPVTVNPTTINSCFGNTVPLTASGGTGGVPATASVGGTSASTSSGSLTPFYRLFENYRVQYLVRAVDLQNAGIVAGNLTSLAFNVTALGTTTGGFPNNMEDYTVKIGTTASTVVTSTAPLSSTFTTVFGPVSYSPTLGVNTLNFATPFNWNGSSNIVIDICFDNDPAATCNAGSPVCWGNTPTVNVANASYTGTWSSAADDVARCGYTGSGSTTNTRPVMSFGYTTQQQPVYTWSPATGLSSTTGPTVTATVGSTIQYTVTATLPSGCSNQGTSDIIVDPNATTVTLELRSDDGSEVSWEIVTLTDVVVCEGGDYPVEADIITANCCLAQGCYRLRVMDSGGDGFGTAGGYQLRTLGSDPTDIRIIDNLGNFTNLTANGSLSAIGNGPSAFCFPFAADPKPQFQHRDKLDFVSGNYLISEEVAAVSAQWQVGNQTDDGYEFWIYDPNGTYAYRRFRNHATSDGFANVGATRACHMKINNWFASQAAPANVLLNVRIRPRVNGVNGPFGPAYRFKIDPARAACPLTKLNDFPGNQFESCDQTRTWGSGIIHAIPVPSANQYQWRFRTVGEPLAPIIVRTTTTYFLQLNWPTNPLIPGKTYTVDVRARKGTTWCTDAVAPALVDPWGTICSLTIVGGNAQGGGEQLVLEGNSANLAMFPNPNRGDQLWLSLDGIEEGVTQVSVDIYDMAGHRAVARMIPTQGTNLNTVLDLSGTDAGGSLAAGVYVVHIMAGDARYTERLVIQR